MPDRYSRALDEYKLCVARIANLESNIWKTAIIFGIGSGVGVVEVARRFSDSPSDFGFPAFIAGIVGITITLVWWRYARRWWAVIDVLIHRMEELEMPGPLPFKMTGDVSRLNDEAQRHYQWLAEHWNGLGTLLGVYLKSGFQKNVKGAESKEPSRIRGFEYRGMVESTRLMVYTFILLWLAIIGLSVARLTLNSTYGPLYLCLSLGAIGIFLLMSLVLWARR